MHDVLRVLLVEDVPADAELSAREVRHVLPGSEFQRVESREDFLAALAAFRPDIILSDYKLPCFDGMAALTLALEHAPDIPFLIITGSMNEATAVACMKAGAWDYVIKEHIKRLGPAVMSCLEQKRLRLERTRAADALRENRRFLADLIEHSGALIFVKDCAGRYLLANRKWEEVTGLSRQKALGRTAEELFPAATARQYRLSDLAVLESGTPREEEEVLESADGTRHFISIKFPVRDDAGAVSGLCGIATEITARKQAEDKIRNQLEELQRWHDVMLGREGRVQELKREVNELCRRIGETARYPSQAAGAAAEPTT